jgi:hypothetical protein
MDQNLALTLAAAFAMWTVFGVLLAAVVIVFIRRVIPYVAKATTTITGGNGAQFQINHAEGAAQINAGGAYTTIQIYEDALAKLAAAGDTLALAREIVAAAQAGRFRGDITETLCELLDQAQAEHHLGAFIIQRGRAGKYPYRTTERDLAAMYRGNGSG